MLFGGAAVPNGHVLTEQCIRNNSDNIRSGGGGGGGITSLCNCVDNDKWDSLHSGSLNY